MFSCFNVPVCSLHLVCSLGVFDCECLSVFSDIQWVLVEASDLGHLLHMIVLSYPGQQSGYAVS